MKIFIFLLSFLFCSVNAHSAWYIIDVDTNQAVSIAQYPPNKEDLDSRGEIAINSDAIVPADKAEYRNGKIRERMKTQQEVNEELSRKANKDKKDADTATAKAKLIGLGLTQDEVDALHP